MLVRAQKSAFSWDRSAVLLGVIGLHVGGIYLVSVYGGLGQVVETVAKALTLVPLPPVETRPPPEPPRERPRLQEPDPFVPPVPDPVVLPAEPPSGQTITARVDDGGSSGGGSGVRLPTIPATPLSYRSRRPTDDYYPAVSIRMSEEGAAIVRVCVDAGGALQAAPQVTDSSGHARLDAAAVTWAREALTFTPATENGARVAACKGFRVRFSLRQ
jgi:protein TonB